MSEEEIGQYLGYPNCCIEAFCNNRSELATSHPFDGTGYVPCKLCAQLPLEVLREKINDKRKDPSPFPLHT